MYCKKRGNPWLFFLNWYVKREKTVPL
jgi:hypothetical protein